MNSISLSTHTFEMSTSKSSKRNLFPFSFWTTSKKKKRKKSYGRNQAEGLSELFFELKLNHTPGSERISKKN